MINTICLEQLLHNLGAPLSGTGRIARCPAYQDRSASLSIGISGGRLLLHCFSGCQYRDVRYALGRHGTLPDRQYVDWAKSTYGPQPKAGNTTDQAMNVWAETAPVKGKLGQIYLVRRGLEIPVDRADIRFHGNCQPGKDLGTALVWLLRDIRTNESRGIQRRFLLPNGAKDGPAMSLGSCTGAVLNLSPDEDVSHGLGIAERGADALAVVSVGWRPCRATCGAVTMASFPVLDGIEAFTIIATHNPAGRKAAANCRARWQGVGREVRVLEPRCAQDFGSVRQGDGP